MLADVEDEPVVADASGRRGRLLGRGGFIVAAVLAGFISAIVDPPAMPRTPWTEGDAPRPPVAAGPTGPSLTPKNPARPGPSGAAPRPRPTTTATPSPPVTQA